MSSIRSRRSTALAAAALLSLGTRVQAQPGAGEKEILAAARAAEAQLDLELCRYGFLQFDAAQPRGAYAYFRDRKKPDSISLRYALFLAGDKTFKLTIKSGGLHSTSCTGTGYVPKPPLHARSDRSLLIDDVDEDRISTLSVTLYDGQLVYTNEESRRPDPPSNTSWEHLRYVYEGWDEDPHGLHNYGTVLVLPKGSPARKTVPKLETFMVHGQRQGASDADFDLTAELVGNDVELTVSVVDDKDVPLPAATASDADLLRSDHLEIWYQYGFGSQEIRQLAVARLANGSVHARWLYPRKVTAPLPKVTSPAPGKFVLQFPAGELFHADKFFAASAYDSLFTAVFSDTDDAKKRQETVVASSTLKWGKPETFGKIVWFENGARFPVFPEGSRVQLEVTTAKPPAR